MATPKLHEQAIAEILSAALLAGRLAPGLRLGEYQLAAQFGVTRERIRKVLHRLGHQRLIELRPNRGAFVADPGLSEAREVYQARRILEGGIVAQLAAGITDRQLAQLQDHLERERQAQEQENRAESVRLSGLFHTRLGDMTGNGFVTGYLHELVSRTAMLVAYHEVGASDCGCQEHASILAAMRSRDTHLHLSAIETRVQPRPVCAATTDLDEVLRIETARWKAQHAWAENADTVTVGRRPKRTEATP
jgi:DNA-binding GntR family transcriptional regulator